MVVLWTRKKKAFGRTSFPQLLLLRLSSSTVLLLSLLLLVLLCCSYWYYFYDSIQHQTSLPVSLLMQLDPALHNNNHHDGDDDHNTSFAHEHSKDVHLIPKPQQHQQHDKEAGTTTATGSTEATNARPTDGVVAFVTFVHLMDFSRFERFIFPALDTWLSLQQTDNQTSTASSSTTAAVLPSIYYVVLNRQWQNKYETQLCPQYPQYCPSRIRPVYVDCPEGKFGASPCCKQEQGLAQLLHSTNYQFYAYHDDDVYFRTDHLVEYLTELHQTDLRPNRPFIITGGHFRANRYLGQQGYIQKKHERNYSCSVDDGNFTYHWGQPVLYPRHTLEYVAFGFRKGGLTKQCQEYQLTHDAGNAVFHWMYSLPELRIRFFVYPTRSDLTSFGTHGVSRFILEGPTLRESRQQQQQLQQKQNQSVGHVTKDMHSLHQKYHYDRYPFKKQDIRRWHNVTGFHQTETYRLYGDPSTWKKKWHTMPTSDCMGPQDQK